MHSCDPPLSATSEDHLASSMAANSIPSCFFKHLYPPKLYGKKASLLTKIGYSHSTETIKSREEKQVRKFVQIQLSYISAFMSVLSDVDNLVRRD